MIGTMKKSQMSVRDQPETRQTTEQTNMNNSTARNSIQAKKQESKEKEIEDNQSPDEGLSSAKSTVCGLSCSGDDQSACVIFWDFWCLYQYQDHTEALQYVHSLIRLSPKSCTQVFKLVNIFMDGPYPRFPLEFI